MVRKVIRTLIILTIVFSNIDYCKAQKNAEFNGITAGFQYAFGVKGQNFYGGELAKTYSHWGHAGRLKSIYLNFFHTTSPINQLSQLKYSIGVGNLVGPTFQNAKNLLSFSTGLCIGMNRYSKSIIYKSNSEKEIEMKSKIYLGLAFKFAYVAFIGKKTYMEIYTSLQIKKYSTLVTGINIGFGKIAKR